MAITSIKDLKTSRRIGIGWMTISIIGAMLTGLVGIAYYAKIMRHYKIRKWSL